MLTAHTFDQHPNADQSKGKRKKIKLRITGYIFIIYTIGMRADETGEIAFLLSKKVAG